MVYMSHGLTYGMRMKTLLVALLLTYIELCLFTYIIYTQTKKVAITDVT